MAVKEGIRRRGAPVELDPLFRECYDAFDAIGEDSHVDGRIELPVLSVGVGAELEEEPDHAYVPIEGGQMQRRVSEGIACV